MHRLLHHCHFKKRPPTAHSEPLLEMGAGGTLDPPQTYLSTLETLESFEGGIHTGNEVIKGKKSYCIRW